MATPIREGVRGGTGIVQSTHNSSRVLLEDAMSARASRRLLPTPLRFAPALWLQGALARFFGTTILHSHIFASIMDLGNLTRHFSWSLEHAGPDHQKVHYATAKLHGHVIGTGSGISIGNAKQAAAAQALRYLQSLPPRHPIFSLQ